MIPTHDPNTTKTKGKTVKINHYATKASEIIEAFGAWPDEDRRGDGFRALCPVHEAGREDVKGASLILDFTDDAKALVVCQSRRCDYGEILKAVGLTPREMANVSYIGQTLRTKGSGAREPVTAQARATAEARAFREAMDLSKAEDGAAVKTARSFGLTETQISDAFEYGVGSSGPDVLTVTARTPDGRVAWTQWRDFGPDADPEKRWISDPREDGERSWDTWGYVGPRHPEATVIVTEGASDAVVVAGLDRYDVVTPRGAGNAAQISAELGDDLAGRDVVVCMDNDEAGRKATVEVLDALVVLTNTIKFVRLPEGFDVRDLRDEDPEGFSVKFERLVMKAERKTRPVEGFDPLPYAGGYDGIADGFRDWLRAAGHDVAHVAERGWMEYDGIQWHEGAEKRVLRLMQILGKTVREEGKQLRDKARQLTRQAEALDDEEAAKPLTMEATKFASMATALLGGKGTPGMANTLTNPADQKRVLAALEVHPSVAAEFEDFDHDPELLGVSNGVVNLRSGRLRPMRASDRITHRLAVRYDPDAKAPEFEKFLSDVLVHNPIQGTDEELVAYVKRVLGYAIVGTSEEQKFWILHSTKGGTGKSQLLAIIRSVFGAIHRSAPFSTFEAGRVPPDRPRDAPLCAGRHGV